MLNVVGMCYSCLPSSETVLGRGVEGKESLSSEFVAGGGGGVIGGEFVAL